MMTLSLSDNNVKKVVVEEADTDTKTDSHTDYNADLRRWIEPKIKDKKIGY